MEASVMTPMFPAPVIGGMMIPLSEIDNRRRSRFGGRASIEDKEFCFITGVYG